MKNCPQRNTQSEADQVSGTVFCSLLFVAKCDLRLPSCCSLHERLAACVPPVLQLSLSRAIRSAQDEEEREIARIMAEENMDDDNAAAMAGELDSLTGQPLPDDIIHYIVPMCAPYDAIREYKYKLKLLPGTAKRGKSSRAAISFFLKNDKISVNEKEMIKLVGDNDLTNVLLSDIKLSAPGINTEGKKRRPKAGNSKKEAD